MNALRLSAVLVASRPALAGLSLPQSPPPAAAPKKAARKPIDPAQAPQNYGVYLQERCEPKRLGRIQSKVQVSKVRTVVKNRAPFMREKIDINIPGAHSTSRFDEVLCDIGPTTVKDLYRITPREDLPPGEFGFVEGNTGSKSTSNIEIIDVCDFGIDRNEDKRSTRRVFADR